MEGTDHIDALRRAYERADHAYAEARRLVYDPYPGGPPPPALLDERQRQALDRLQEAEAEVDRLRLRLHGLVSDGPTPRDGPGGG